jgi:hypothetical protein
LVEDDEVRAAVAKIVRVGGACVRRGPARSWHARGLVHDILVIEIIAW